MPAAHLRALLGGYAMSMSSTRSPLRCARHPRRCAAPGFEHGAMLVAALLVAESSLPLLRPGDGAPRARAGLMIRRTGRLPLPALRSRAGRFPVSELAAKRAIRPAQAAIALQELLIALADGTTGAGVRAHARVPRLHPGLQRLPSPTRQDGEANCKDPSMHLHTRTNGGSDKWSFYNYTPCPASFSPITARSSPALGPLLRERTRAAPATPPLPDGHPSPEVGKRITCSRCCSGRSLPGRAHRAHRGHAHPLGTQA